MEKDKKLVQKILKGDRVVLKTFFDRFQKPLFSFILKRIGNTEDAKDILQETMASALKSLPGFEFRCSLFSWLCTIARHETVDFYRKKKVKAILFSKMPILEEIADQALSPEGEHLKEELKEEIKNILKQLSEGYSKILRLKYVEELSVKAIAGILKITAKAVESRLTRARNKFKILWRKKVSDNLAKEYLRSPFY